MNNIENKPENVRALSPVEKLEAAQPASNLKKLTPLALVMFLVMQTQEFQQDRARQQAKKIQVNADQQEKLVRAQGGINFNSIPKNTKKQSGFWRVVDECAQGKVVWVLLNDKSVLDGTAKGFKGIAANVMDDVVFAGFVDYEAVHLALGGLLHTNPKNNAGDIQDRSEALQTVMLKNQIVSAHLQKHVFGRV